VQAFGLGSLAFLLAIFMVIFVRNVGYRDSWGSNWIF